MNKGMYNEIYKSLNSLEDIETVSNYFNIHTGIISNILSQKIITKLKNSYGTVKKNSPHLLIHWNNGKTIVEIAQEKKTPSTLIASLILKELKISKKIAFKSPDKIQNKRLRYEIIEALKADYLFSPFAHEIQLKRGILGEDIINLWLTENSIDFLTEKQLRIKNVLKTPDFLFDKPLIIDEQKIYWIESKAMFGSESEHKYYTKKQFSHYEQMIGKGLIVYWYGYIDTILDKRYIIKDYKFFTQYEKKINQLMNLGVNL